MSKKTVRIVSECREIMPMTISKLHQNLFVNVNTELGQTINTEDRESIKNDGNCQIRIIVYKDNSFRDMETIDMNKILFAGNCAISQNGGNQFVVTVSKNIKCALSQIFPFTEAIRVLGTKKELFGCIQEKLGVVSIKDKNGSIGGWLIYPEKNVESNTESDELNALISIIREYGERPHLEKKINTAETSDEKKSKRNHAIRLEKSTGWINAEEYIGNITKWENCIYTLVSEPDSNGICKVYIGEATNPKNTVTTRISTFNIDGKIYIDHTRKEALENRFTRFRIDKLMDESTEYLHDMQDLAIGIPFMLCKECPNGYIMTNDAFAASYNEAIIEDKNKNGLR